MLDSTDFQDLGHSSWTLIVTAADTGNRPPASTAKYGSFRTGWLVQKRRHSVMLLDPGYLPRPVNNAELAVQFTARRISLSRAEVQTKQPLAVLLPNSSSDSLYSFAPVLLLPWSSPFLGLHIDFLIQFLVHPSPAHRTEGGWQKECTY